MTDELMPPVDISRDLIIHLCEQRFGYVLRTVHEEWYKRGMTQDGAVKVLKEGTPVTLHGECPGCHTTVETNTRDARKYQVPIPATGMPKVHFEVTCPTCGTPFEVMWHGPGCPGRAEPKHG